MITTKEELKKCLELEAGTYRGRYGSRMGLIRLKLQKNIDITYIWKYMKAMRKTEYYCNKNRRSILDKLLRYVFERRKNRLGSRLGFSIEPNILGEGAIIYHPNVVINRLAAVGRGCRFHGNNCIGVGKGESTAESVPKIGNHVEFGFGAVVLGGVTIADNITIGANAVVTRSFLEEGITIAGVPAVKIGDKK